MKRYRIVHRTSYHYQEPVALCHNEAHLEPRQGPSQRTIDHQLVITPTPDVLHERQDYFGNRVTFFSVQERHESLTVTSTTEVELSTLQVAGEDPPWERVRDELDGDHSTDGLWAREFRLETPFAPRDELAAEYASKSFTAGRPILDATRELMRRIHTDFKYDPHFTTVATPLTEVWQHRRGVCQDFAHLALSCLRSMGLAGRYVSGYLETTSPPGKEKLVGADASHAWASVYRGGGSWVDFDPTNNHMPVDSHVTVAWGRDYGDVTPLKGIILGGGKHALSVSVDMSRIDGDADPPLRSRVD